MSERVVSVNVGRPIEVPYRGGTVRTGIFKAPIEGRAMVSATGLEGDGQADLSVHGGEDKAVYLYSEDSYEWWRGRLGHALQPGELGENLTVTGLTDDEVRIGDRLRAGEALLEVTQPREPCFKLGIRMGDPRFVLAFREAGRTGFYARVIGEGEVGAGDTIEVVHRDPDAPTVRDVHGIYVDPTDLELMGRVAQAPGLAAGWREWMERKVAEGAAVD